MKTLMLLILVSTFFAFQTSAQEQAQGIGSEQPPVRWIDYLSEIERTEIARKLAVEELQRLEATGELYLERPPREVSFPVTFVRLNPASTEGKSASLSSGGGNVSCNINTQSPHAGSGPGGTVVKAKSSGSCEYEHGYGVPPLSITWDLQMLLSDYASNPNPLGIPAITTATHSRHGLNVTWSSSSAQVFANGCVNGSYFHTDVVWVMPPPGWVYSGPQPIAIPNGRGATVGNC